ncbi:hypothetical protein Glove_21g61 [Diversispora epigaea]|uniref:Uncharacterized protein n=1 Tax=Diversispora epigaea TaxID=1348612 RepID=A0A397JL42_9GLOM|nr:hypothetical protein Glove_21g61 [Diversispora epigaea]
MSKISDDQLSQIIIAESIDEDDSATVEPRDEEGGEAYESIEIQGIKEAVSLLFQNLRECKTTTQDKILNTKYQEISDTTQKIYTNFRDSLVISERLRSHSEAFQVTDTDAQYNHNGISVEIKDLVKKIENNFKRIKVQMEKIQDEILKHKRDIDKKNDSIDIKNNEIIMHKEKKEIYSFIYPRLALLGSIFQVIAFLILFFIYPSPHDSLRDDVLLFAKGFFLIFIGFGFSLSSSSHEKKVTETEKYLEQTKKFLEESNKNDVEKVEEKLSNLIKQLGIMCKWWNQNRKNLEELIIEPNPQLSKEKWESIQQQCDAYFQNVSQVMNENNRLKEIDLSNESESSGSRNDENNVTNEII